MGVRNSSWGSAWGLGHKVFAQVENLEAKQIWGRKSVEDKEFAFGHVRFELPVKLQMET